MYLVLVRHGESIWNLENRFTGWTDVPLTDKGKEEAKQAGLLLKEKGISFDTAYTSLLKRAIDTFSIIQEMIHYEGPVYQDWHLNERHYGALQGLNKEEMKAKCGEEQVRLWRRSYDVQPPALTKEDERYPGNDLKYQDLTEEELPLTECLKDTMERTVPYYQQTIQKDLMDGKNVLVVAHGNSLRSIRMYLDHISEKDIMDLEIPLGIPYVYEFDENLNIVQAYYL